MITKRICVYGIVQGVGFRPTVSRHAMKSGITGSVCNKGPFVEIIAQGQEADLDTFLSLLKNEPPRMASILRTNVENVEITELYETFDIIESEKTAGEVFISPDLAICPDCERELFDSKNPRYLHPFINCTCCGPRLTILDALPYDRERTSMKVFPMCDFCQEEYTDPATRRYDAQPVCCPNCGPHVYAFAGGGELSKIAWDRLPDLSWQEGIITDASAITAARRTIASGGIVAVKGIGGFHLCCDATSQEAVLRLREMKHRPVKPFAVMAKDVEAAENEAVIGQPTEACYKMLTGHQKPICLLPKKEGGRLAKAIAPGNQKVGLMLPYAPLHHLLFTYTDDVEMPELLVMTSGNVSGAPICKTDEDVKRDIMEYCDLVLSHDRPIRFRADDSVVDFFEGEPYMVRRSRGFAPLPIPVDQVSQGQVLAVGGDLKNCIALTRDGLIYPSPYIGDMEDMRSTQALSEAMERMTSLMDIAPTAVVTDLHPKYHSVDTAKAFLSRLSEEKSKSDAPRSAGHEGQENGMKQPGIYQVQHHYAHILSCLAENNCTDRVIGLAFDGTGFGSDGTIWGGEVLAADVRGFERLASIKPFFQVGGDAAAKEGWRVACSMIFEAIGQSDLSLCKKCAHEDAILNEETALSFILSLGLCDENTAKTQYMLHKNRFNGVISTSMGRLFDAVSAILGICRQSTFEGEAAQALQGAAEEWLAAQPQKEEPEIVKAEGLRTDILFREILQRKLDGEDAGALAYYFHQALADMTAALCGRLAEEKGIRKVALSGGVFQNTLLLGLLKDRLTENGLEVLHHHLIPPNDGGLSLGQALYGLGRMDL